MQQNDAKPSFTKLVKLLESFLEFIQFERNIIKIERNAMNLRLTYFLQIENNL